MNNMIEQIKKFAVRHPRLFFDAWYLHSSLTMDTLYKYHTWMSPLACKTDQHYWTAEGFLKLKDWLGYSHLPSNNPDYEISFWIPDLYAKYPEYYHVENLPNGEDYDPWEWTEEKIDQFAPKWEDWGMGWNFLSNNKHVPWTTEMLEKYKNKLDWRDLCYYRNDIAWTADQMEQFKNYWDWPRLCGNQLITWTEELLVKFEPYLNQFAWDNLSYHLKLLADPEVFLRYKDRLYTRSIHWHLSIRWDLGLLEAYWEHLDWSALSNNRSLYFPWSLEFLKKHQDLIDWKEFSNNPNPAIPWSSEFLDTFKDRLDWEQLSNWKVVIDGEHGRPWTEELLQEFEPFWDFTELANNPWLTWTEEMIERYAEKYQLLGLLSSHRKMPWSEDLIAKYQNQWDWAKLLSNDAVSWDWELLLKYEDKVDNITAPYQTERLWNKLFAPYLDDESILTILEDITPQLPRFQSDLPI